LPKFIQNLPKFRPHLPNFAQICPNFAPNNILGDAAASPTLTSLQNTTYHAFLLCAVHN